jgi:transcriptional regulator with XRE-family HTH domain
MILADKIIDLRKKNGMSQEDLAHQLNVSRQSVSKWEAARSIPDMDKILNLADLFGVSTDYLLRDDIGPANINDKQNTAASKDMTEDPDEKPIPISLEEATAFLDHEAKRAAKVALGVSLCVASAAPLMFILGVYGTNSDSASTWGSLVIVTLVAIGIAIIVMAKREDRKFQEIRHEPIDTAYGIDGVVRERRQAYDAPHVREMALGIALCVASCVPLLAINALVSDDNLVTASVGLLLLLVAAGVFLIVHTSIVDSSFSALLEEDDYTRGAKLFDKRFSGMFWGITTAGYLLISFLAGLWNITWVVWPVTGIIWGAIVQAHQDR